MDYKKIEYYYWRFFNIFIRLVGFLFFIIGCIVSVWNFIQFIRSKTTTTSMSSDDIIFQSIAIIAPLVFVFLGFLIINSKAYFPKHIEKWVREMSNESHSEKP
mgnify:FL=1|jgi:uncharacterized BrkB/YihY/UPF0761 family membrane protein